MAYKIPRTSNPQRFFLEDPRGNCPNLEQFLENKTVKQKLKVTVAAAAAAVV